MFGQRLTAIEPIKQALGICTQRAAEKLRARNLLCNKIRIRIRTWMFNSNEPKYANGTLVELPHFANDVRLMTKGATEAVNRLFRPGYKYSKAEVLLLDLRQLGEFTDDLFAAPRCGGVDERAGRDQYALGRGTLGSGSVPTDPEWAIRRDMMSQSYTTKLDQLWTVRCD